MIIGQGAGFMFCWRGDVVWKIGSEATTKDLSHVDSDEFILAIPDFTKEPIETNDYSDQGNSFQSSQVVSYDRARNAMFRKVIMKLNGGVRWIAGLVFERRCPANCVECDGKKKCRRFSFIPHYKVRLKTPEFCRHANGEVFLRNFWLTEATRQLSWISKRFYAWFPINHQPS
jgi:hypothetical protein